MEFIDNLIKSGDILARSIELATGIVKNGISTIEIDSSIEKFILGSGAKPAFKYYNNYQFASCVSVNNILVHGLPTEYKVKNGDVVSIDIGVNYQGAITDGAITLAIGIVSENITDAINQTRIALKNGIIMCRPGNSTNDISLAIENVAVKNNLGIIRELSGHGTGKKLHLPPSILNYSADRSQETITKGMVLAIEPMFCFTTGGRPDPSIRIAPDGWSVALKSGTYGIHFEHTILVTDNEPIILTKLIDNKLPLW